MTTERESPISAEEAYKATSLASQALTLQLIKQVAHGNPDLAKSLCTKAIETIPNQGEGRAARILLMHWMQAIVEELSPKFHHDGFQRTVK